MKSCVHPGRAFVAFRNNRKSRGERDIKASRGEVDKHNGTPDMAQGSEKAG